MGVIIVLWLLGVVPTSYCSSSRLDVLIIVIFMDDVTEFITVIAVRLFVTS